MPITDASPAYAAATDAGIDGGIDGGVGGGVGGGFGAEPRYDGIAQTLIDAAQITLNMVPAVCTYVTSRAHLPF